jgi:hypothetical protein
MKIEHHKKTYCVARVKYAKNRPATLASWSAVASTARHRFGMLLHANCVSQRCAKGVTIRLAERDTAFERRLSSKVKSPIQPMTLSRAAVRCNGTLTISRLPHQRCFPVQPAKQSVDNSPSPGGEGRDEGGLSTAEARGSDFKKSSVPKTQPLTANPRESGFAAFPPISSSRTSHPSRENLALSLLIPRWRPLPPLRLRRFRKSLRA